MHAISRSMFQRATLVCFVLAALPALSGCELFGDTDELLEFDLPLTYTVPVTVPIQYPDAERIQQLQNANERSWPLFFYVPIDLSSVSSQLTSADVVEEVTVSAVTMEVVTNTLEGADIQPFELRVGEPGTAVTGTQEASPTWEGAVLVAETPVIPHTTPQFVGEVQATVAADQNGAADRIAMLSFGFGMGTHLVIPEGSFPAGGRAEVQFTLELVITINPL